MNKIKKGDQVIVITGKDKGRTGTVIRVDADDTVLVENVNVAKKHTRGNPQAGIEGGIVERELPIHRSNVAIFNPLTNKADRVGIKVLEDGKKVRVFKSDGENVDV